MPQVKTSKEAEWPKLKMEEEEHKTSDRMESQEVICSLFIAVYMERWCVNRQTVFKSSCFSMLSVQHSQCIEMTLSWVTCGSYIELRWLQMLFSCCSFNLLMIKFWSQNQTLSVLIKADLSPSVIFKVTVCCTAKDCGTEYRS